MIFEKHLEERELVMWQLRLIYHTISWEDLEKMYWVWKTPDYKNAWVNAMLAKTRQSANILEQRLCDIKLLSSAFHTVKTRGGKPTKIKIMDDAARKIIDYNIDVLKKAGEINMLLKLKLDDSKRSKETK